MEEVFKYIIGLGAAVMMPIIFTVLGLCIGIKFGDALKSGLKVGVGFVGLSVITALLTSSLGPALDTVVSIYDLQLHVFDMGWPAAAAVPTARSTSIFGTTGISHSSERWSTSHPGRLHGDSSPPLYAMPSRLL